MYFWPSGLLVPCQTTEVHQHSAAVLELRILKALLSPILGQGAAKKVHPDFFFLSDKGDIFFIFLFFSTKLQRDPVLLFVPPNDIPELRAPVTWSSTCVSLRHCFDTRTPGQPQCHPHMFQQCHHMLLTGMWPLEEPSFGKITLEPSFATFHHVSRIRVFLGQKAVPRNTFTLLSSGGPMVCRHIAAILLCYPKNISGSTDARLCKQEGLWGEAEGSWGHVLLHCPSMRLLFQILQAQGCGETTGHGEYRKEGMHCLDY